MKLTEGKTIKGKLSFVPNKTKDLENLIIKELYIDSSKWYIDEIKVKKGNWIVASKKRDQDLEWKVTGDNQQLMSGHAKRENDFLFAENQTFSVEVKIKRLAFEFDIEKAIYNISKNMPDFKFSNRQPIFKPGSGNALEISTFDAHFGKLAAEFETGYRNYDLKIAAKDYKYGYQNLINWSLPFQAEKAFVPIGQDIFHIDNMAGKTTRGEHTMDVDGRVTKVAEVVLEVMLQMIYELRRLHPVKIIWSPGNHDYFASYMLCMTIKEHFKNDDFVEVDLSQKKVGKNIHKCELWGKTLVGFTHRIVNRHALWVNELAQSFPNEWSKSVFREWHYGDQHKKKTIHVSTETVGGVNLRQLTALSPVDKWHTENLFTDAIPGSEGYMWSKTKGVFLNMISWTGQYEKYRNKLINQK